MDTFYQIMEFLIPNGCLPSADLLKEYSRSEVTKELNTLPPLEYLNSKFDEDNQMSEDRYELLRKRFDSLPPFVFYFYPNIELMEKIDDGWILAKGFFGEEMSVSLNK